MARIVLGMALGLVASTCLLMLLGQLGVSVINTAGWPWYGGVLLGIAMSAGLSAVRVGVGQLRIKLTRSRAGFLVIALAVLPATTIAFTPQAAMAQADGDCEVFVTGQGIVGGPQPMSATAEADPLTIDPGEINVFQVRWQLANGESTEGARMRVWTTLAGREITVFEATGDSDEGLYVLRSVDEDIAPGTYEVSGDLIRSSNGVDEVLCRRQIGWVKVLGSPLTNGPGIAALLGLIASLTGLAFLFRFRGFDLWSFTTPERVTVDIVDRATGRPARGRLRRGYAYNAKVTVEFPDPPSAYLDLPGPVEVAVGLIGSGTPSTLSSASITPANGHTDASVAFTVPSLAEGILELGVNLSVSGNVIQSIRIVEPPANTSPGAGSNEPRRIAEATGHVVYRSASWAASDLVDMRPVAATVMLHGNRAGTSIDSWVYQGDPAVTRHIRRHRTSVAELNAVSQRYRAALRECIAAWSEVSVAQGHSATYVSRRHGEVLGRLADLGAELKWQVLGDVGNVADLNETILIAHDTEATGAMTFPWTGLYEGMPPPASEAANIQTQPVTNSTEQSGTKLCHLALSPQECLLHPVDVVCPKLFWGLRYELAWPNGWVPTARVSRFRQVENLRRLLRPNSSRFRLRANIIANRVPVKVHSAVAGEFTVIDNIESIIDGRATISRTVGLTELTERFDEVNDADIVVYLGHGYDNTILEADSARPVTEEAFALGLDDEVRASSMLDGERLSRLADRSRMSRGPLVVLNACGSGVLTAGGHHRLLDELRRLGASGVIVTESAVRTEDAVKTVNQIVDDVVQGDFVSHAVLNARRRAVFEETGLSRLAYSYYGPPGLRLASPAGPAPPGPDDLVTLGAIQ